MKNFNYYDSFKYPTQIVLNLTDDCNLACRYCFVQQKPNYMTLQIAKDAIDYIVKNYNFKKENNLLRKTETVKTVIFFGGEPMLMFDKIIVPLINYIENTYDIKEFQFHITTNGTLLNKDNIDFLKKYNIVPLLSIDGNKITQDYNRPCKHSEHSSFDLIYNNIPYILKNFPKTIFRSTVYKDTIQYLFENFLFAESMGFKKYTCIPDCRSQNWTTQDIEDYKNQLFLIYNYILNKYQNHEKPTMNFNNMSKAMSNILFNDINLAMDEETDIDYFISPFRCGLGIISCSVNYKGEIFSCQEQDSREYGEYFHIGNIYDGIDVKKHHQLLIDYLTAERKCEDETFCSSCLLNHQCCSGCPSTNKDIFNDLGKMPKLLCEEYRYHLDAVRALMIVLVNQNNEIFKEELLRYLDEGIRSNLSRKEE